MKRHPRFRIGDPEGEVGLRGIRPLDQNQEGLVKDEVLSGLA